VDRDFAAPKKNAEYLSCGHRFRGCQDKRRCRASDQRVAGWIVHMEFERSWVDCRICGDVHVEPLGWLAKNPRYSKRFALHMGKLCRSMINTAA
jgi:transposase